MCAFPANHALLTKERSVAAIVPESIGRSSPLGSTVVPGSVNFSVFSRNGSDLADDEWRQMICIETSNVSEFAVDLASDQQHTMKALVKTFAH